MVKNLLSIWEKAHREKVLRELQRAGIAVTPDNIPRIIEETSFKVRSKRYPEECPYYGQELKKSCHPEILDLNCFLCACPNYLSSSLEGGCRIDSPNGRWIYHPNLPAGKVWDCSNCDRNHSPEEVRNYLIRLMQA